MGKRNPMVLVFEISTESNCCTTHFSLENDTMVLPYWEAFRTETVSCCIFWTKGVPVVFSRRFSLLLKTGSRPPQVYGGVVNEVPNAETEPALLALIDLGSFDDFFLYCRRANTLILALARLETHKS